MAALNPSIENVPSAIGGSAEAFGKLVDPHRRELLVHCYRMLGSIDDAEDAVQDALAHAWRGRSSFQRNVSLRAWLYRIATNACLDAIERRKRGRGREENLGVGPFPDQLLGEMTAGPEARYDARESISLAFLTALQVLPPRQRAVLILRDVLSWHSAEVAELLEMSVPSVNSALQRARTSISQRYASSAASGATRAPADSSHLRSLLERYVRAWEAADITGLVALLRDDAVLSMPPAASVSGGAAIGAFLARTVLSGAGRRHLVPTGANNGPAFVVYASADDSHPVQALAVLLIEGGELGIARINAFFDPQLVARFASTAELAG